MSTKKDNMTDDGLDPGGLSTVEKNFLLLAERGDCGSVKALLNEYMKKPEEFDINCVDPLDRTALIAAIENENMELINILLQHNIKVKDALLHAIKEEYVEAVEVLLQWEEEIHVEGEPYSWEAVDRSSSNFTPDITPLILAAHTNNYEILKILLDRGATLPIPHEIRCACDECLVSREQDSLRHSQSRINAYRALTAPSLIALSSKDPILTAFELSWELRRMSRIETEFRAEYNEMRQRCQEFASSLLDHTRTSAELEIMLNHDPDASPFDIWQPGDHQSLERLKLAIKYKQKNVNTKIVMKRHFKIRLFSYFMNFAFYNLIFFIVTMDATLGTSEKGKRLLIVNAFKFSKQRDMATGDVKWRCNVRTCQATIKTDGLTTVITESRLFHNHPAVESRILERSMVSAAARRKAESSFDRPAKILRSCLSLSSMEVLEFVAHPNVQQLMAAIWYEGLPGFRRKGIVQQFVELAKLGAMFPLNTSIYMMAPNSNTGLLMKKPFIKFINHSASYGFFLMLLGMASQRIETLIIDWIGMEWTKDLLAEWKRKERGSIPGMVEGIIIIYVISLIWSETRSLWEDGILEYINDLWNIVDFVTYSFYSTWIFLRATAWFVVKREEHYGFDPYYPRENWHIFDPMLISEGAFAAGMIFSFLKLVHIFSVNPHLGPLQISLGRMIIDIIKFFFIYTLVLFAFGCGLNQLMWYYADLEKRRCYHLPGDKADFDDQERACTIWRRFANLFETSQSLFWAGFGLVDLMNFELTGIKGFTRFWALLMFGSYSVINIIVLLNMLIAMMSNSYQIISERADTEWKFARSKLWISYFDDGDTVPPPFNLLPSVKNVMTLLRIDKGRKHTQSMMKKSRTLAQERHQTVMKLLIRRYVTAEQRKRDEFGITEDDVMEIRQDISTLRFELIDILGNNGMKTPKIDPKDSTIAGKKGRVMERRLLKDFQIGFVEGVLNEAIKSEKEPKNVFTKIAKAIGRKASTTSSKKDWNALVRQGTLARNPIGSTYEAKQRISKQSVRRHIIESVGPALKTIDPDKLLDYNPKLSLVSPAARVAYAKFKISKIKSEYTMRESKGSETNSEVNVDMQDSPNVVSDESTKPEEIENVTGDQPCIIDMTKSTSDVEEDGERRESFRARTPISEDPKELVSSPPPKQPSDGVKKETEKVVEKQLEQEHDCPITVVTSAPSTDDVESQPSSEAQISTSQHPTPVHEPVKAPAKPAPGNWL